MLNTMTPDAVWIKHAAESQYRGFTFEDLATGETIESCACTVLPSVVGELTAGATGTISGANVSTLISGGLAGHDYDVRFTIVTSSQPVVVKILQVKVIV